MFTDRVEALAAVEDLARGRSGLRALVVWGVSGQGKTTLLSHVHATGWAGAKYGLAQLSSLIDPTVAAGGHGQGPDLARALLDAVADAVTELCPAKVRRKLMRAYRAGQADARAQWQVRIGMTAAHGSSITNSPVTAGGPSPAMWHAQYRQELVEALAELAEGAAAYPGIVLIDTSELLRLADEGARRDPDAGAPAADLDTWFTATVLKRLVAEHPGLRFVVAGREPLDLPVRHARVELTEWRQDDTAFFLDARGVPGDLSAAVHTVCGGTPVWTAMTADLILGTGRSAQPITLEARGPAQPITADWLRAAAAGQPAAGWLPAKYLERLSDDDQHRLLLAAVPRTLTHELWRDVCTDVDCTESDFHRLRRHSFVQQTPSGSLRLHPLVRSAITAYLHTQYPKRWRAAHRAAAAHFEAAGSLAEVVYHRFAASGADSGELTAWWQAQVTAALDAYRLDEANLLIDAVREAARPRLSPLLRAHTTYFRGRVEYFADDYPAAGDLLEQALGLYRESNDRRGQADTLRSLGNLARIRTDDAAAARRLALALGLYRDLDDRHGQAHVLRSLGDLARVRGDDAQAGPPLDEALGLYRELDDRRGQAHVLRSLGNLARVRDDDAAAEPLLNEALGLYRELEDRRGQAHILWSLANSARMRDDDAAAERLLNEALGLYRELEDRRGQAHALFSLGDLARVRDDDAAARRLLDQALGLYRDLGDRRGQAHALFSLGDLARTSDDDAAARRLLDQALGLYRHLGDRRGQAHVLRSLGDLARASGDDAAAEPLLEQALGLYRDLDDRRGQADTLRSLGQLAQLHDDHGEAGRLLERALVLHRDLNDRRGQADTLRSLGDLAQLHGDRAAAKGLLDQALELYRELEDRRGQAHVLWSLGDLARFHDGDDAAAGHLLEQALGLYRDLDDRRGQADILWSLGDLARARGDDAAARRLLGQALGLARAVLPESHGLVIGVRRSLGEPP
ncbi:tetratricopeptide repeat protein [Streptomyces sp. NPDC093089]|uniref:tetratricopeptide repeat protein n=1 Tax=Streptomyces sp. NPDC093089 TaxID=3366024 RepID=UPI00380E5E12